MKRREFLRQSAIFAASPWILPSGRLFAPTGERKVNHVVLCLFAGGIRNFESVQQIEGSLMPFSLGGNTPISSDIREGIDELPEPTGNPLTAQGTLYREFRYSSSQTIHFNGHATAIMGAYSPLIQIMQPLPRPTLFEFYRKHNSPARTALNAWWVTDQGGPFSYLNYSAAPGYGAQYGANMIHSATLMKSSELSRGFHHDAGTEKQAKQILSALQSPLLQDRTLQNTEGDREKIAAFMDKVFQEKSEGKFLNPWGISSGMNEDMYNMYTAIRVLQEFQPELLVVNMQHSDICHSDFTQYCNNIRKADFALHKLWEAIQSLPGMKDDTVLIALPEFGRNLEPNTLRDKYGRLAFDHTGDATSKEIFCLVCGPPSVIRQNGHIREEKGNSIDVAPTIAHLLGFLPEIPQGMLRGSILKEALR